MALRCSLSLLLLMYLILHASIAHYDPVLQTMEDFSGYPSIEEPPAANPEEAQQNQIRMVQVSNLSLWASTRSIISFFSSCGEIESVEMQSKSEQSQIAFVTFKHSLGADCAIMLSGTKLLDLTVIINLAHSREIPSTGSFPYQATGEKASDGAESHLFTTKDVFSSILEKGYVLGKAFAVGTSDKVQQVDQNFQVSKKIKSAVEKSAVWGNQYVSIGASWVTVAFDSVAKAAAEVSQHAKEKAAIAEEEQRRKTSAEEEQGRKTEEQRQRMKMTAEEEQRMKTTAEEEQGRPEEQRMKTSAEEEQGRPEEQRMKTTAEEEQIRKTTAEEEQGRKTIQDPVKVHASDP